jgi:hypothetical protein
VVVPGTAVSDSGATRTLLTQDAAKYLEDKEGSPQEDSMEVIYGGGERGNVEKTVVLGEIDALVVPNLSENLVSLGDFTSRGSTVVLTETGGKSAILLTRKPST